MSKQLLFAGTCVGPVRTASRYYTPFGGGELQESATESDHSMPVAAAGKIRRLGVSLTSAPGAGKSWTIALRVNGSTSACTVTISDTNTYGYSVASAVASVAKDDLINIILIPSGTPASTNIRITMEFEPTTPGQTLLMGSTSNTNIGAGTRYVPLRGTYQGGASAEFEASTLIGTDGSIENFNAVTTNAPGVGSSRQAMLVVNGVDQDGTGGTPDTRITISGTNKTGSLTSIGLSVSRGDAVTVKWTIASGTPAASTVKNGVCFVPLKYGEFLVPGGGVDTWGSATEYNLVCTGNKAWGAGTTGDQNSIGAGAFRVTKFNWELSVAAGVGNSFTLELLWAGLGKNSWATTIADTNTYAEYDAPPLFPWDANGLTTGLKKTAVGTPPGTSKVRWCAVAVENEFLTVKSGVNLGPRR